MTWESIEVLMAEDDEGDQILVRKAFARSRAINTLTIVNDGEELMRYLRREPPYAEARHPDLLLLDLNMPKKDGREVLREIKQHPLYKKIPVIIFSTTNNEHEMRRCYELGANSYITKPNSFEHLIKTVAALRSYWIQTSITPH